MNESTKAADNLCVACLCSSEETKILDYQIQYTPFGDIFEVSSIKLCYICKRVAQHAELFIKNVQSNTAMLLLESCCGGICTTIEEVHSKLELPINLSLTHLDILNLSGKDSNGSKVAYNDFKVTSCGSRLTYKDPKETSRESKVTGIDSNRTFDKDLSKDDEKLCNSNAEDVSQVSSDSNVRINSCIEEHLETSDYEKTIKIELKEEDITFDHLEDLVNENDGFEDSYIKEEDDFPLKALLKKEIQIEGIEVMSLRRTLRKKKVKKRGRPKKIKKEIKEPKVVHIDDSTGIETIYITEEQCMEERKKLALDTKYTNCPFKCKDCLKGFNFKASYEMHLEKHSPTMGAFICDICKLRMDTEEKLNSHKRYHTIRYKCTECGIVRISRLTIKDHFAAYHRQGERAYVCPFCSKAFNRQVSQRKHVRYTHLKKERVTCAYCHKSYANKDVLKTHMRLRHPKEVSAPEVVKPFSCEECGICFKTPSLLKNHGTKHSLARDFYCVECDKAFKSEAVLKQHLKTAQPHINYLELPLTCAHCTKKFSIRRDLDRHMNRVHLDIKPFKCDTCDKAYVNNWSLIDHKRHVHEGYRRPLRYPCKLCDKIFDRNSILKAHIRTHTGERPYQCSKCPAQFSQSGVLATHNKLIHLKLTRDGRPKPNSLK